MSFQSRAAQQEAGLTHNKIRLIEYSCIALPHTFRHLGAEAPVSLGMLQKLDHIAHLLLGLVTALHILKRDLSLIGRFLVYFALMFDHIEQVTAAMNEHIIQKVHDHRKRRRAEELPKK